MIGRELLIFGGSFGADYLNDFVVLDTDPRPEVNASLAPSRSMVKEGFKRYYANPEFSDVTFVVEGRQIPAHKLILSVMSERFRVMFSHEERSVE